MRAFAQPGPVFRLGSWLARVTALIVTLTCANIMVSAPARAAKMRFGTNEYLQKIQDIDLKGPNGEALYLGYKYAHHSVILPYRTSDDGYILGVVGQQRYYPLDTATIEKLQAKRLLPSPLPAYSLSLLDYLMGHLAWLVLAIFPVAGLVAAAGQRRRKLAIPFAQAGLVHHRSGNLDAAIAEYDQALERDPKLANALMLRGDARRARGDIDHAISDYSKIIKLDAKSAVALMARGTAFEAKGLIPRAIDDYTRAIKSSKAPVAYFMRANAYLAGGDAGAAIKDYTSAIDRHTDFAAAYQGRATAYEHLGKADLAVADKATAARLGGSSPALRSA